MASRIGERSCRWMVHGTYRRFGLGTRGAVLTLAEAASRTDVSVVTLRRAIKDGRLRHQPRKTERDPYLLDEEALVAAGYTVHPDVRPRPGHHDAAPPADYARLIADLEAARAEILQAREERDALLARVHRAEGELSATKRDFDVLTAGLTPALAAITERLAAAPQLERQVIDARPVSGEPVSRVRDETDAAAPRKRRWFGRSA